MLGKIFTCVYISVQFVVYWFQKMVAVLLRFEEELKYFYKKGMCVRVCLRCMCVLVINEPKQ